MKASDLRDTLIEQSKVDNDRIETLYATLRPNASIAEFRSVIIDSGVMSYSELMSLYVRKTLLPRSSDLLNKITKARNDHTVFEPPKHKQKFHIKEYEKLTSDLFFSDGALPIHIPRPKISSLEFGHSDEKQAVMLAFELADLGELTETEIVLIETLESFQESTAAVQALIWVYMCTNHLQEANIWSTAALKMEPDNRISLELISLCEQMQNKHLLASAHYQKLLQRNRVKSLWYFLLAYSQEQSQCRLEAVQNYKIYATIGKEQEFTQFATQHMKELMAS